MIQTNAWRPEKTEIMSFKETLHLDVGAPIKTAKPGVVIKDSRLKRNRND